MIKIYFSLHIHVYDTQTFFSFVSYQTWQYCEVADIEPFQGQSDQIFQFSIIRIAPEKSIRRGNEKRWKRASRNKEDRRLEDILRPRDLKKESLCPRLNPFFPPSRKDGEKGARSEESLSESPM